jgi:hypothetical protein
MDQTLIMYMAAGVLMVLYLMRRRTRLSRDEE